MDRNPNTRSEVPRYQGQKSREVAAEAATVAQALADSRQPASVTVAAAAATSDSPRGPKLPIADAILAFPTAGADAQAVA